VFESQFFAFDEIELLGWKSFKCKPKAVFEQLDQFIGIGEVAVNKDSTRETRRMLPAIKIQRILNLGRQRLCEVLEHGRIGAVGKETRSQRTNVNELEVAAQIVGDF
jgi:hypothetical protein